MLSCEHIRKSFGGTEVLHGLSLSVQPGQIAAVIGPSGAGKSTLLRAMSLLDPPDSGAINLDGTLYRCPIQMRNGFARPWPKLTVVFQQLFLWPHLTLRQNVTLPLRFEFAKSSQEEVDRLIDLFELSALMERFPNEVSLGERQRIALIRALALKPKYLLLDEITSALDVEQVSKILDHLQRIRNQGTAVVLVTHLIGFAKSAADQVMFMEGGHILESGGPYLLVSPKNPRLQKFLSLVETTV